MTEAVIMDWFLYDNGLRHERVKTIFLAYINTVLENLKKEIQIFQDLKDLNTVFVLS